MISVSDFLEKKRAEARALPTNLAEGPTLEEMCDNARLVAQICDALGFEFRGYPHMMGLLEGARAAGHELVAELVDDPDNRPYIWDLEE